LEEGVVGAWIGLGGIEVLHVSYGSPEKRLRCRLGRGARLGAAGGRRRAAGGKERAGCRGGQTEPCRPSEKATPVTPGGDEVVHELDGARAPSFERLGVQRLS
jgi:hypothetical protein